MNNLPTHVNTRRMTCEGAIIRVERKPSSHERTHQPATDLLRSRARGDLSAAKSAAGKPLLQQQPAFPFVPALYRAGDADGQHRPAEGGDHRHRNLRKASVVRYIDRADRARNGGGDSQAPRAVLSGSRLQ